MTETLDDISEVDPAPDCVAIYEMAHMTIRPDVRGLDLAVILHGVRVMWMLHAHIAVPPLWLVMADNTKSYRLITQIGAARVAECPPSLLKGLTMRADKVREHRPTMSQRHVTAEIITVLSLPSVGLNQLVRVTAGAHALLGPRLKIARPLSDLFNSKALRALRLDTRPLPWADSPAFRTFFPDEEFGRLRRI
jgi:hypothetical protein